MTTTKCGDYREGDQCPSCFDSDLVPSFAADEPRRRGLSCPSCGFDVRCDRCIETLTPRTARERAEFLEAYAETKELDESEMRGLERELWEAALYTIANGIPAPEASEIATSALRTLTVEFDRDPDPLEFLRDIVRAYAGMLTEESGSDRYMLVPVPRRTP